MYSDLFDALGGGTGSSGHVGSSSSNRQLQEDRHLASFKAGKMEMELKDNGKYWVTPDTRRGQVNLKYNDDNQLVWEWFDRREKVVVDTIRISSPTKLVRAAVPSSNTNSESKTSEEDSTDQIYYWKCGSDWKMIWLQDKEVAEGLIDQVNDILKHPTKPQESTDPSSGTGTSATTSSTTAAAGSGGGAGAGGPASIRSPGNASTASSSSTTRQVDALSNILENLGMPQGETHNPTSSTSSTNAASSTRPATGGTLTLADLQGVMAGLQQQQSSSAAGAPVGLQDVVSSEAINDLLSNEDVKQRLLQELPQEQRSMEYLEENLRSPQVQQTLRTLTSALLPDDNGSMEGYHSVLANFQMDAAAGQATLTETNNPILAFLECVLASVKKDGKGDEKSSDDMKED